MNESNVFIHGLGQTSNSWEDIIHKISGENYCPDLSDFLAGKEQCFDTLYRSFEDYCNNIDGELNLCGLSLGGMLALKYAANYPHKVKSLVLISTKYKMQKFSFLMQLLAFRLMPKSLFKNMSMSKEDLVSLTQSMKTLNLLDDVKRIKAPCLLVCGVRDIASLKISNKISSIIDDSRIAIIDGGKNELNVKSPRALRLELLDFYTELNLR